MHGARRSWTKVAALVGAVTMLVGLVGCSSSSSAGSAVATTAPPATLAPPQGLPAFYGVPEPPPQGLTG